MTEIPLEELTLEAEAEARKAFDEEARRLAEIEAPPLAATAAQFMPQQPDGQWAPKKMRYWYEMIADQLMIDPKATGKSIGKALGRSPEAVRLIMNSDAFRAYWEQRRGIHNAILDAQIRDRVGTAAALTLDEIIERMRTPNKGLIPFDRLQETASAMLEHLGYGGKAAPGVNVQVNNNSLTISRQDVESARQLVRDTQAARALPAPTKD